MKLRITTTLLFTVLWMVFLVSCNQLEESMQFTSITKPQEFNAQVKRSQVTLTWSLPADTRSDSVHVDLSKKEDFSGIDRTMDLQLDETTAVFKDLDPEKLYFARVRILSDDPLVNSGYAIVSFTTGPIENIFLTVADADITESSVVLKWNTPEEGSVTSIVLTPTGGSALPAIDSRRAM